MNAEFVFFQKKVKEINSQTFSIIRKKIQLGRKLNVGFLVNEAAKWNCTSIVDLMRKESFFSAKIYHDINLDGPLSLEDKIIRYKKESAFFKSIDRDLECLFDENLKIKKSMSEYDVDIIFFQQPWGLSEHLIGTLGKSLSIYMPYSYLIYDAPMIDYGIKEFHGFLWKYLSQSAQQKKDHLKFDPSINGRQWVVGYPKFDDYKLADCLERKNDDLHIIYAPHHSFKNNILKISTFDRNCYLLLDFAKNQYRAAKWTYKPHPRLQSAVIENGVMSSDEYSNYFNEWDSLNNVDIHTSGDYIDIFKNSDILITDCASFLAEYYPTGKPIVWLRSEYSEMGFNEVGEDLSKAFYVADNNLELKVILDDLVYGRNDYKKDIRKEMTEKYFSDLGDSGIKIIEYLRNAFIS